MSVLAVIPARLGATRLPRKPLRLVGGEPLIVRVWQRVSAIPGVDVVVVATDSGEIGAAVERAGGAWCLTSPLHPSGTDRVAEVAAQPAYRDHDVIVNIQGDEPFVSEEAVEGAVAMLQERGFALGTVASPGSPEAHANPDVVKVVCDDDGRALYFSRAPIPFLRDPADRAQHLERLLVHVGIYAYTPAALRTWVRLPVHPLERVERLEQLRPLAAGLPMGVSIIQGTAEGGVDTEADLVRANARWNDLYAGRM
jgi:3-deoxy-manno-octulosonate cytidylyltransferase (CMP-KDO synthetase)